MAKYLTRQRKRLLEYLSEHTDEQISARQIAEDLAADQISISAVYRNISALEEEGLLKRSVREGTRAVSYTHLDVYKRQTQVLLSMFPASRTMKASSYFVPSSVSLSLN